MKAFDKLTGMDQRIVLQCLKAILSERYVDAEDYPSRMGIEYGDITSAITDWPDLDDSDDDSQVALVINNSLNEVCHGVDIPPHEWTEFFDVDREVIRTTYKTWAKLKGWKTTGIM
jgi:hypothetical protein